MHKPFQQVATVADLKAYLQDIPDDTPIGRMTNGYYQINKLGDVAVFCGELPVGLPGQEITTTMLRISA